MHYWGGAYGAGQGWWFINMPYWAPAVLAFIVPLILVFVLWSFFWKGLGLWHAARRGQYWWFIIMLLVNTLGILEIIYLFLVAKLNPNDLFSKNSHHHSSY